MGCDLQDQVLGRLLGISVPVSPSVVYSPCLAVVSLGKQPRTTFLYLFRKTEQRIREQK